MNMEGRHQGRSLAYQIQSQIGYTTQFDLGKGRDSLAGTRRGNKNKQHMNYHPEGLLLIFIFKISRRLLLPLVGDYQLRNIHQSPTNADVKR